VSVNVMGDDGETANVALHPDWAARGSLPPVAHCTIPCELQMPRGPYSLEVLESPRLAGGSRPIVIDGRSRLVVTPRDRSMRTAGLVLGISGIAAIVGGIGLIADGLKAECRGDVCSSSSSTEAGVGLAVLIAGAALTPIGWVIFGKSFHPGVDVEHPGAATTSRARVGVVPLRSGAGLGGSFVL
jgi:hypothetical protein